MPRKVFKKRAPKRRYRRKPRQLRRRTNTMRQVTLPKGGFADSVITKLVYTSPYNVSDGGAVTQRNRQWNVNSLYDPDLTGTGTQPMGFDQLATIYNKYQVFGCAYEWTLMQLDRPSKHVAIATNSSSTIPADVNAAIETPYSKSTFTNPEAGTRRIKGYVNIKKLLGQSQAAFDRRYNESDVTGSPSQQVILNLMSLSATTGWYQYTTDVKLTFYCKFFERKAIAGS